MGFGFLDELWRNGLSELNKAFLYFFLPNLMIFQSGGAHFCTEGTKKLRKIMKYAQKFGKK